MAIYKQPCINCGTLIERDAHYCPKCGSTEPFGYMCPTCLSPISKEWVKCQNCGRELYIVCPLCGEKTFTAHNCEKCGGSLMVECSDKRCGEYQFFENEFCSACGKKIKNRLNKK